MNRLLGVLAVAFLGGCGSKPEPPPANPPLIRPDDPPAENPAADPPKNALVVTPAAAKQIQSLTPKGARVYLRLRVSHDREYKLDLDEEADSKQDALGESGGVATVVDRESLAFVPPGLVIDYVDKDGVTGFRIANPAAGPPDVSRTLAEARKGFETVLLRGEGGGGELATPPADVFAVVRYDAAPGKLAAYLTPDPGDGRKRPAIIWITGGDCNTIDEGCWRDGSGQSAGEYRKAGVVMMFPSLRGGNNNPGRKESFYGEVDDVLAAAAFLAKQPHVDPARIYLGGHSTGGTMALLTAECSDRFRAVFSFGPTDDVLGYSLRSLPFAVSNPKELELRAPGRWLHGIRNPVFVFEGSDDGNGEALRTMAGVSKNPKVRFFEIPGANHFNLLGPTNSRIVEKLLKDVGPTCNLTFTQAEIEAAFAR